MPISKCERALETLLAHEPALSTSRNQKVATNQAPSVLIRLAAAFAEEFTRPGMGDELGRRVDEFDRLTSAGSPFDQARGAAHAELTHPDHKEYIQDSPVTKRVGRRVVPFFLEPPTVILSHGREVIDSDRLLMVRDRLSDREQLRWDSSPAEADADYVLALRLSNNAQEVFNRWRKELWDLRVRVQGEHLLGSYLIEECRRAVAPPNSNPDDYKALLARLSEDPARFTKAIQDAADDLFHSCDQDSSAHASVDAADKTWCHSKPPSIRTEFKLGPIDGTQKYLASLICLKFNREEDPRALQKLGENKRIRIERVSGHTCNVYFRDCDSAIYKVVHDQHELNVEQQKGNKKQKKRNKLQNDHT